MPKITVWKCPHTKQLFEDETKYRKHLGILKRDRARARLYQSFIDSVDFVIDGEKECNNAQELCEHVLKHSKEYMLKGVLRGSNSLDFRTALRKGLEICWPKFTGMKIYRSKWSDITSNSHSAPRGKKQNWGGDVPDTPRGYPGWHGQFRIWHDEDARIQIVDAKNTRIRDYKVPSFSDCTSHKSGMQTGSGGGRKDGSYYDMKLFAEDFPEMEKMATFLKLKGPPPGQPDWKKEKFEELDEMGEGRTGHVVDGDPFD